MGRADVELFAVQVFHRHFVLGTKRIVQEPLAYGAFAHAGVAEHHQPRSLRVGHDDGCQRAVSRAYSTSWWSTGRRRAPPDCKRKTQNASLNAEYERSNGCARSKRDVRETIIPRTLYIRLRIRWVGGEMRPQQGYLRPEYLKVVH